ncbi:MAG TPA: hypothetical protein DCL21_06050 [Alphaproteobacteria bacterium]|nr:hypothetical protein [Alphaproteobacteria bacterium]
MASCASNKLATEKKELRVDTRMSHSIFLEPVDPEQQIIYVKVKNSSGNKDLRLQRAIVGEMTYLGYQVTNAPSKANFMLQANIRNYTSTAKAPDGSGETIVGAVLGGVLGSAIGDGKGQEIATALGAVAGGAAGQKFSGRNLDVEYTALVDLVIAERSNNGLVDYRNRQNLTQGEGTSVSANFTNQSQWKKYRTKLVSKATKINLTEQEATQAIVNDIINSLSGLF